MLGQINEISMEPVQIKLSRINILSHTCAVSAGM